MSVQRQNQRGILLADDQIISNTIDFLPKNYYIAVVIGDNIRPKPMGAARFWGYERVTQHASKLDFKKRNC